MMLIPMVTGVEVTFWICAVLAILGAVGLVTFRKPVYSALCLALVMISLAVIYASLGAPFLFAVQIIVYTGAILMLFLFVIMLVGVASEDSVTETLKGHRVAVAIAGLGVLVLLVLAVAQGVHGTPVGVDSANTSAGGNVQGLADLIFSRYVIAFESTAALLITAAVAAMVLAHPELIKKKAGQTQMAAARLQAYARDGVDPGPRPSSGIFARHNSIATPALLPDGTIAQESVSKVLADRVGLRSVDELWGPHDEVLAAIETAGEEPLDVEDLDWDDDETAPGELEPADDHVVDETADEPAPGEPDTTDDQNESEESHADAVAETPADEEKRND
ncbi:MAG: NADH-quinone oxidoreductase subunit J [Propionibacteriaceae bacterium]|nr:NADH-quinone oxidoreductase subunit J [Propionibacteriaceae bacterium]